MLIQQVALVSRTKKIKMSELTLVAAALQKQATRDLGPIWNVQATVDVFEKLNDVPVGYWPIIIQDSLNGISAEGYHTDRYRQPFSLVKYSDVWKLTCSHELCEMLVDPFGSRMVGSGSIKSDQGRVNYLVEVCDPCEDDQFAYYINGIRVSDFYTPNYFDPVKASGVRYSFSGSITEPKQVLKDGYLSWLDPTTAQWWQANYFDNDIVFNNITDKMGLQEGTLRARIDRITNPPLQSTDPIKQQNELIMKHAANQKVTGDKIEAHWEQEINRLLKPKDIIS